MSLFRNLPIGLAALAASLDAAAQAPQPAPAEPAAYRSAFEGYKPFEAGDVQDWRKSNDTVREIGGWRAYAREMRGAAAAQPAGAASAPARPSSAPAPAASAPAAQPAADPHKGHHQ